MNATKDSDISETEQVNLTTNAIDNDKIVLTVELPCGCNNGTYNYVCQETVYESCTMNCDLGCAKLCFSIGADDVVIDGAGYLINYTSTYGINNSYGYDNITIKNLKINQTNPSSQGFGIFLNNSDNSTVEYNNLSNAKIGVLAINSFNVTIQHNQGSGFSYGAATAWSTCHPFNTTGTAQYYESGIWLVYSNNGTLYNNSIYGNETESGTTNHDGTEAGITLCSSNYTNISTNTLLYVDTFGFLLTKSYYNDIFYNFVNGSNALGAANTNDGIILGGPGGDSDAAPSHDNNVSYNEFYKCDEWGIFIGNSDNNTIYNNTANKADMVGIRVGGTSSYNDVINNIANNNTQRGILIDGDSNLIQGNEILNNGIYGIQLRTYGGGTGAKNILIGNRIEASGSGDYGIYFNSDGGDNLFYDNIINSTDGYDIRVTTTATNNFTNCTFDKSDVYFDIGTTGKIFVKWYMDVIVNYTNSSNVTGATVNAYDVNNSLTFTDTTEVNGFTSRQNVTEYYENSTQKYYLTNYSVNATKGGTDSETEQVNLTTNFIDENKIVLTLRSPAECGCSNGTYNYSCGETVYESCTMNCDLNGSGTCLTIGANDVVIDGNGSIINYSATESGNGIKNLGGYDNVTVKNCVIKQTSSSPGSSHGIYYLTVDNGTIFNNTIFTYGGSSHAIYLQGNNNNITTNIVNTTGLYAYGFYLYSSNSNTLYDNNITTYDGFGLRLDSGSDSNTITYINIKTGYFDAYPIYFWDSTDNNVYDSIFNNTSADSYDIKVHGTGTNNLTNCTFNKSTVYFESGATGKIYIKWYMDVYVNNSGGAIVEGATVNAYNINNSLSFTYTTDASGLISRQNVTEYYENSTQKYYLTNYSVNATKNSYSSETEQVNLTTNFIDDNKVVLTIMLPCGCSNSTYNYTCQETIYESCTMNCDLDSSKLCFSIGADDVVIDGAGYLINYSSMYGINNSCGYDNITIKNLRINQTFITKQGFGIFLNNSDNSTVEYCNFSNSKAGILAQNSFNVTIQHNYGSHFEYGAATEWDVCQPFNTTDPYEYYESGIWLLESDNGTIYNNSIYGNETQSGVYNHGGTEAAITLCRSNYTNISDNTLLYIDTFGIYLRNSSHTDVFYNFVNGSNTAGTRNTNDGIILDRSDNNNISHNEFYSSSEWEIFLSNSDNNTIYNNTAIGVNSIGIRIASSSKYNKVIDNFANDSSAGIRLEGDYNFIEGNELLNNKNYGIDLTAWAEGNASNNTIINNIITTSSTGPYISDSCIRFADADDNLLYDNILNASGTFDIFVTDSGVNNLTNCSFNKSNIEFLNSDGTIYVKWYLDAIVNYSNNLAVDEGDVLAYDVNKTLTFNKTTNSQGKITRQNVTEYYENATQKYMKTNYSLSATDGTFWSDIEQINLTTNAIDDNKIKLTLDEESNLTFVNPSFWGISMYNTETRNLNYEVKNVGDGELYYCSLHTTGNLNNYISFNVDNFNLSGDESKDILLSIVNPAVGTYSEKVNITCNTSTNGLVVSASNCPNLEVTVNLAPVGNGANGANGGDNGGAGGGGGGGGCSDECLVSYCKDNKTLMKCGDWDYDGCLELIEVICLYMCRDRKCIECREKWICAEWSKCENRTQTRTCEDLNKCGTEFLKPAEIQGCGEEGVGITEIIETFKENLFLVFGILISGIIALIIIFLIVSHILKSKKKGKKGKERKIKKKSRRKT
jgi:parallel beta-helix repeat protein